MRSARLLARPLFAVLASASILFTMATPATAGVSLADSSPPGPPTPIEPVMSTYGNPFNDYLRRPYGVLGSPQQQETLQPVHHDTDKPFDWYRNPRAAIGVLGGPEETIITPEGYLRTVFGTLTFSTGTDRTPVNQRVKTWKNGHLPILEMEFVRDEVRNHFEFFAAEVPGVTKVDYRERYGQPTRTFEARVQNMINFVEVELTNTGETARTYRFSVGLSDQSISPSDGNTGPSRPGDPSWDAGKKALVGDGKVLLTASKNPTRAENTLDYAIRLAPGTTKSLVFKMPYFVAQASDLDAIHSADYGMYLQQTTEFWSDTLEGAATRIDVPGTGVERKVIDTYKANAAFSLLLVDIIDGKYFWDANPTVYDRYWLRDTAFDVDGLLNAGFTEVARGVTLGMRAWQQDDGQFQSQSGQNDGNGQALWAFGNYYARTHDAEFAQKVWPAVQRAMAWEWQIRQDNWDTDGGLFPTSSMGDNEGVRGHVLTYDLWNIAGEWGAIQIAEAVGADAKAKKWRQRRARYIEILREALAPAVGKLGWIPPAIEGMKAPAIRSGWYGDVYGIDWGNLEVVWPTGAFPPGHPWVSKSLKVWREKTFEGVFGYPWNGVESTLHSYTPMSIAMTYIRRGNQWKATEDLYGLLTHTSATHMASEGMSAAQRWGWSRGTDTMPHAEFAGKYLTLLRDMLAYGGQDGDLHLANVWLPVWSRAGERIAFEGETDFGRVAYDIEVHADGAVMHLDPPTRNAPRNIVVSVPRNATVTGVTVDGESVGSSEGNQITLPALTEPATIEITWKQRAPAPPYSFERAVEDYLANYRKMTSPADVHVEDVTTGHPSVRAGYPLQLKATIVNTGGAAYLEDPRVRWYVDGEPVGTDRRTLARGIGFTTPKGVVSFDRKTGGVVPVGFVTSLCERGKHTIGVGIGGGGPDRTTTVRVVPTVPSQPAPQATTKVTASPSYAQAGDAVTTTATITNEGCSTITDVRVELRAPDAWSVRAESPSTLDGIEPGESATVTWRVEPPAELGGKPVREATVTATVSYGWSGHTTGTTQGHAGVTAFAPVQAPYRTYASTEAHFGRVGDRFAVYADGYDMWRGTDEFGTVYLQDAVQSEATVTTRVVRQDPTGPWAKAGIVVRNDLTTGGSPGYVLLAATPSHGVAMQWDSDGDGQLDRTVDTGEATSYPVHLKLERDGTTFTGYASADGTSWQRVARVTVSSAAATQDVGLAASAVTGDNSGRLSGVVFDGFGVDPAPPPTLGPDSAVAGAPVQATFSFTNWRDAPVEQAEAALRLPAGWSAQALTPTEVGEISPFETWQVTWKVSVPPGTAAGEHSLRATASYTASGQERTSQAARDLEVVRAASNLAEAYNNVGITDDENTAPGNLDGNGNSFSAQALADVGLTPGATITHNGISFTWPDVPAGEADNVAGQAAIQASVSGDTLAFIGAGVYDQTGTGTVLYSDGSTQKFTLTFPNWAGSPPAGADVVAEFAYRNTPSGPANFGYGYQVFYDDVALRASKTVAAVILPDNPRIHVFTMAID